MQAASQSTPRPTPQGFDDHRDFLGAMVEYLKGTHRRFSYRYFARKAGFASPSFLKLVIHIHFTSCPDFGFNGTIAICFVFFCHFWNVYPTSV